MIKRAMEEICRLLLLRKFVRGGFELSSNRIATVLEEDNNAGECLDKYV
jgi:hypothetical protein